MQLSRQIFSCVDLLIKKKMGLVRGVNSVSYHELLCTIIHSFYIIIIQLFKNNIKPLTIIVIVSEHHNIKNYINNRIFIRVI